MTTFKKRMEQVQWPDEKGNFQIHLWTIVDKEDGRVRWTWKVYGHFGYEATPAPKFPGGPRWTYANYRLAFAEAREACMKHLSILDAVYDSHQEDREYKGFLIRLYQRDYKLGKGPRSRTTTYAVWGPQGWVENDEYFSYWDIDNLFEQACEEIDATLKGDKR